MINSPCAENANCEKLSLSVLGASLQAVGSLTLIRYFHLNIKPR